MGRPEIDVPTRSALFVLLKMKGVGVSTTISVERGLRVTVGRL
jgi:hypothetical protein